MDFKLVDTTELKTLEQYGSSLVEGIVSLKTMEAYHVEALKKGLLDTDETETTKTICWEIQRLVSLYATQIRKIVERTGFDEAKALNRFRKVFPDIPIPRKKRNGKTSPKSTDV